MNNITTISKDGASYKFSDKDIRDLFIQEIVECGEFLIPNGEFTCAKRIVYPKHSGYKIFSYVPIPVGSPVISYAFLPVDDPNALVIYTSNPWVKENPGDLKPKIRCIITYIKDVVSSFDPKPVSHEV